MIVFSELDLAYKKLEDEVGNQGRSIIDVLIVIIVICDKFYYKLHS